MKLQCKNENVLLTDLYAEAGAFDENYFIYLKAFSFLLY